LDDGVAIGVDGGGFRNALRISIRPDDPDPGVW
jgi:hypothetical protein